VRAGLIVKATHELFDALSDQSSHEQRIVGVHRRLATQALTLDLPPELAHVHAHAKSLP
jgi:hypothetical protein